MTNNINERMIEDLEKERLKREREKAIDSIDWEALQAGETAHYDKESGVYESSGDFRKEQNERDVKLNKARSERLIKNKTIL